MNDGLHPTLRLQQRKTRLSVPQFRFGNCLLLDDVNDFGTINVGVGAGQMPTVNRNGSFSAWAYFNSNLSAAFFSWGSSTSNRLAFSTNSGGLLFIQLNGTSITFSPAQATSTGSWAHFVLNWTDLGSSIKYDVYIDGVFVATATHTTFPTGSTVFRLGTLSPTGVERSFGGRMDEVLVYDRPLQSSEILALYGAGYGTRHVPKSGLLARWTMDETSGTTAADASGNARSLTLVNGPTFIDHFAA